MAPLLPRLLVVLCAAAAFVAHQPPPQRLGRPLRAEETTVELVSARIREALPQSQVSIESADDDPNGMHVSLYVVDESFEGLSRLKRQQAVYRAIRDVMDSGRVHAVDRLTTKAPSELA
mmetsp:Transcript_29578/g.90495  ORF Transcript_29578/g.90495 Transcript_29578/m.90495 type:complete len:119 (+) Transcript_29578:48-404(+)